MVVVLNIPCNAINFVFFVQSFVPLVVKYFNHKVHKEFHKGHKEKCQFIGVLWYKS